MPRLQSQEGMSSMGPGRQTRGVPACKAWVPGSAPRLFLAKWNPVDALALACPRPFDTAVRRLAPLPSLGLSVPMCETAFGDELSHRRLRPRGRRKGPPDSCCPSPPGPPRPGLFLPAAAWSLIHCNHQPGSGCFGSSGRTCGAADVSGHGQGAHVTRAGQASAASQPEGLPHFALWYLNPRSPALSPLNSDEKGCLNGSEPGRPAVSAELRRDPRPSRVPPTFTPWLVHGPQTLQRPRVQGHSPGTEAPQICPPICLGVRLQPP